MKTKLLNQNKETDLINKRLKEKSRGNLSVQPICNENNGGIKLELGG